MGFKAARQAAGLSVREVMEMLGISDAAIYSWETGANFPKGKRLLEVAKLYGVTVDELLRENKEGA